MLLLLVTVFLIRLYSAIIISLQCEEEERLEFARKISFSPSRINLPIGDRGLENRLLTVYILKVGYAIFGESNIGGRIIFALLGTFSLYFIHKLAEQSIGVGLFTLLILDV